MILLLKKVFLELLHCLQKGRLQQHFAKFLFHSFTYFINYCQVLKNILKIHQISVMIFLPGVLWKQCPYHEDLKQACYPKNANLLLRSTKLGFQSLLRPTKVLWVSKIPLGMNCKLHFKNCKQTADFLIFSSDLKKIMRWPLTQSGQSQKQLLWTSQNGLDTGSQQEEMTFSALELSKQPTKITAWQQILNLKKPP